MRVLRTPDERFAELPDFPHQARYADVPDLDGGMLRMAFVEATATPGTSSGSDRSWSMPSTSAR